MSGSHFNHNQYYLNELSEEIRNIIDINGVVPESKYDTWYDYSEETIKKFEEAIKTLERAYAMVKRIDWLVSSDDGEETFHKRWDEELKLLERKYEKQ